MLVARTTPPADGPVVERLRGRASAIAPGVDVRRLLPLRGRRQIGPWTFLDHMGPMRVGDGLFDVAAHPHCGLSTVTWLVSGELLHRDSLGTEQRIVPGQLNWMTAGRGIAHSEEVPYGSPEVLEGIQLWVALPDAHRNDPPSFQHVAELPVVQREGVAITVLAGSLLGQTSAAKTHSPLVAAELAGEGTASFPVDPSFEHGLVAISGTIEVAGEAATPGELLYLGRGRDSLSVTLGPDARAMLVGGEPLNSAPLLWWNFVVRDEDEVRAARAAWEAGDERFGAVPGYEGGRTPAPPLP